MTDENANSEEPLRRTQLRGEFQVVVCGGGPAGCAAAIRAAREGARTLLLERSFCLGGIWTAGLMPWIIDQQSKTGLIAELRNAILSRGGYCTATGTLTAPPEELKILLEEQCADAGVTLRYGTIVADAATSGRRLIHAITESKSGREAWSASMFIDCTGDGDLAALAGCNFEYGNADGLAQPASLVALVGGIEPDEVNEYLVSPTGKIRLFELLCSAGCEPSYAHPSLFHYGNGMLGLMSHHGYGVCGFDADSLTRTMLSGRAEIHRQIAALRSLGGVWRNLRLVATAEQLGIRESRRIRGLDSVTVADMVSGRRREHPVCVSHFCADVHAPDPRHCRTVIETGLRNASGFYIPYRALISADIDNLLMGGRCISGDFFAHSSYRVTGNAVPIGEAAGFGAARAALHHIAPQEVEEIPFLANINESSKGEGKNE